MGELSSTEEVLRLRLLGGFDLRVGDQIVALPLNVRRVMALLAVRELPQTRTSVAYTLWMDVPQSRASANLRSTLWKLGPHRERLLRVDAERLWLASEIQVDFTRVVAQAKRLIGPQPELQPGDADVDELVNDLLPDWDEDWLQDERERLRQLRVHALEALCTRLRTAAADHRAPRRGERLRGAPPVRDLPAAAVGEPPAVSLAANHATARDRPAPRPVGPLATPQAGACESPLLRRAVPAQVTQR
jgi:DNA-binding SARP family transcriptional activator